MKKHVFLFALIAAIMVVPMIPQSRAFETTSQTITSTGTINNGKTQTMEVGLNYLSTYHQYSPAYLTDTILNRDFSKFKNDGISAISLSLYWYRLEGNTRGAYDDSFLSNIKHVVTVANQYGIKVLITMHTLWSNDSLWCTPKYVVDPITAQNDGLAIVRSDTMQQAFIDMFNHTVTYLKGTPGLQAWALLNEPWYWGRTPNEHDFITSNGQTQKENFINLIEKMSSIVKTNNAGLVTVKFISTADGTNNSGSPYIKNIFTDDWNWDVRILATLDFISFDEYLTYPQQQNTWENMVITDINGCIERGKQVWITEFGVGTDDPAQQATGITAMVSLFKTLPIKCWLAWFWEGDSAPSGWNQDPGQFGKGYNLCASADGTPRPAYYDILP